MAESKRRLVVVIDGEEYVSEAAGKAEKGVGGLMDRIKGSFKGMADFKAGFEAISAVVGQVVDAFQEVFRAYDAQNTAALRLEGTSKLTGIALKDLRDAAKSVGDEYSLSKTTSADLATALGTLSQKAGDVSKMTPGMEAFLDLGASKGLSPEETLQAVQQSILGIDEGTDKLFGKNPSALYEDYAKKIGTSAGKLSDQQKAQAILDATMIAGEKVRGAYSDYLGTAAGQQAMLNTKVESAKAAFGEALQPVRLLVLQGLAKLLEIAGPIIIRIGEVANVIGVRLVAGFADAREAVGKAAITIGQFVKSDDLQEWGKRQIQAAEDSRKAITEAAEARVRAEQRATDLMAAQALRQITATKDVAKAHEDLTDRQKKALEKQQDEADKRATEMVRTFNALRTNIDITTGAFDRLGAKASTVLPPGVAAEFNAAMKQASERAGQIASEMRPIPDSVRRSAVEVGTLARGALDAATAFGVIDRTASTALTSAMNMADVIGKMAASGLSFAGVAGLLGGVANIVSTMTAGDAERRRLLADNSRQLQRLREEGIAGVGVSGRIQQAASDALDALFNASPFGLPSGALTRGQVTQLNEVLRQQGLSMAQLDEIARSFSISIRDREGRLIGAGINDLLAALNTGTGPGNGAAAQLAALRDRLRVDRVDEGGILQALGQFFGSRSSALSGLVDLNNLEQTFLNLRGRLDALDRGQIDRASFGDLSEPQFRDALLELLGLVNSLRGAPAATPPAGTASTPRPSGITTPEAIPSSTAQTITASLDEVLRRLSTSSVNAERSLVVIEANTGQTVAELRLLRDLIERQPTMTVGALASALADRAAFDRLVRGGAPVN